MLSSNTINAEQKCQASLEAAVDLFPLSAGQVSVPSEFNLVRILRPFFTKLIAIFDFRGNGSTVLAARDVLERVLLVIFDADERAFVTEADSQASLQMLDTLDNHAQACLLAQAVCGLVLLLHRLDTTNVEITPDLLTHELELFAEDPRRAAMLKAVSASPSLKTCYTRDDVMAMLKDGLGAYKDQADQAAGAQEQRRPSPLPQVEGEDDAWRDSVACSIGSHSNMGVPSGLQVMTLN